MSLNQNILKIDSYFNLKDYIDKNSIVRPLSFDSLILIFSIYFGILLVILTIYLSFFVFKYIKNFQKKLYQIFKYFKTLNIGF